MGVFRIQTIRRRSDPRQGRTLSAHEHEKRLLRDMQSLPSSCLQGALAIGNFDGVHCGHAQLIERLVESARRVHGPAVVLTFDPAPLSLLRPDITPPKLTTLPRRTDLLRRLGVDWVIAYPTQLSTLQLSPEDFFQSIVVAGLKAKSIVEGANFFFGKDRKGNVETLRSLVVSHQMTLDVVEMTQTESQIVSSSRIRELLQRGDVAGANRCLTAPYSIEGQVVVGSQRGRDLGFPTANLAEIETLVPGSGVYAAVAEVAGQLYPAAVHIGPNPTYGENQLKVEAHIIGYRGDLYGTTLRVEFRERIRDVRRFGSVDELREQLQRDIARAAQLAAM
jgi:riboflavin kinase / FMN adenylyltransferase